MRMPLVIGMLCLPAWTEEPVLTPGNREVPGRSPVCCLVYENATAQHVAITGEWDRWSTPIPMRREGNRWTVDLQRRALPEGRHEYKFKVDGTYEPGGNRYLFLDDQGRVARRPEAVLHARMEAPRRVEVRLQNQYQLYETHRF